MRKPRKRNPSRSDRVAFGDAFEGNPFEDLPPLEAYAALQWDKPPEAVWEIQAPEPLVALGDLAGLDWGSDELELWNEDEAPYLAVGRDSNMLYVVPKSKRGQPLARIPKFNPASCAWGRIGRVRQTDYYSNKGGEPSYYYHNHEPPYPTVWEHPSGVRVVVPARHKGKRSYAVVKEGIIG